MFKVTKILDEVDLCGFPAYLQKPGSGACSAYATAGCLNILGIGVDPEELWNTLLKGPAKAGSRRVAGIRNYVKRVYGVSSEKIVGLNSMMLALTKGRPIILETHNISFPLTGSAEGAMANFNGDGKYKHVRCITGYSKKTRVFKCRNSHGEKWGDKGYFYIKFQDIGNLGVMYSLYK